MSINAITGYLRGRGYKLPADSWYTWIETFKAWYQGYVEKFHHYTVYNGTSEVGIDRYHLGMAKTICEDHANLLLNEKVTISAGSDEADTWLEELLTANNFYVRGNNLVELAYALGTGAFVEYLDRKQEPIIDYIRGDMIFPLSWDNGRITECAFGSLRRTPPPDSRDAYYIQLHRLEDEEYVIENVMLDAQAEGGALPLPEGIEPIVYTHSAEPLFQIVRPNIINNLDLDCPMGISVFGNAVDQLKGCDLIFDSYMQEFNLGRKRIIVPLSMAQIQMGKEGTIKPVFDPHDVEFYALASNDQTEQRITEINMELRAEAHEVGLDRALDMLGKKCGLGNGRYKFESGTVKTATEVISEKSELYQNLKKNEIVLRAALEGMVRALAFLSGHPVGDVVIGFDDSVIEDAQATMNDNVTLVGAGLKSKLSAIMDIQHCDEAEAQAELDRIDQEQKVVDVDLSAIGGGEM